MSIEASKRSEEFLRICDQFNLGALTTEGSHPVTATLSETAQKDLAEGLRLLFEVDEDVVRKYQDFVQSQQAGVIATSLVSCLRNGGNVYFTGCGSTGRLSIQLVSIWRDFWQRQAARGVLPASEWEDRAFAVMAGGDYALIKSVEGFEDFTAFGKKQLADLGVSSRDVVFAITEGGETSFVIGTAWQGVEAGAKVYFVYNNPDEVLCLKVQRSREVIQDSRIHKLNLTTGPMAITGSTRMQATTIQLCVLLTILEMAARQLLAEVPGVAAPSPEAVPSQFLNGLTDLLKTLKSDSVAHSLGRLVALEEQAYRSGHKNNYLADYLAVDVLTDTTERSPTYCTPPFRKFDDATGSESWAFLFVPAESTPEAWRHILKRNPSCVSWSEAELRQLVADAKLPGTRETIRKISSQELMRFRVGLDGLPFRRLVPGDVSVGIFSQWDSTSIVDSRSWARSQLETAVGEGARVGLIYVGSKVAVDEARKFVQNWKIGCEAALIHIPETDFLLDGITRVGTKLVLNALSTCTMVRLGRVMGNYMIWVVPSNLKLIDRATRYIQNLTKLGYQEANRLLFDVIEYVAPRMKADQIYPPVVGMAVLRAREKLPNEVAEQRLMSKTAPG